MINEKGTYILFFKNLKNAIIDIGTLGKIIFEMDLYLYVGSAFGFGGLKKRNQRHLSKIKKKFWHIDYISTNENFKLIATIEINSLAKEECLIMNLLLNDIFTNNIFF